MSHCLRPRQIINPHFNPKTTLGAKNLRVWRVANNSPQGYPEDYQILIDCGKCLGCLRDKARSWRVRLLHEHMFGNHDSCTCLTLTIAPEYYERFQTKAGMASAMRAFIDRLRYYTPGRRSPKRFFISELGEERGRLHFHGFAWDCNIPERDLARSWRYGFICAQPLRSARQLSYATKYITNPPLVSTNQRFSYLPVSDSPTVSKSNGDHGTREEMLTILLICIASLILLCMLCLVIIARKFLRMMKYATLKLCYPNLSDPLKRFSAGRPIPIHSPMHKIEQSCSRLLFGRERANL